MKQIKYLQGGNSSYFSFYHKESAAEKLQLLLWRSYIITCRDHFYAFHAMISL